MTGDRLADVATARGELLDLEQTLDFEPLEIRGDRLGQVCDVVQTAALVVVAVVLLRRR